MFMNVLKAKLINALILTLLNYVKEINIIILAVNVNDDE